MFSCVETTIAEGNKVDNNLLDKILETMEKNDWVRDRVFEEENLFTNEGTSCEVTF